MYGLSCNRGPARLASPRAGARGSVLPSERGSHAALQGPRPLTGGSRRRGTGSRACGLQVARGSHCVARLQLWWPVWRPLMERVCQKDVSLLHVSMPFFLFVFQARGKKRQIGWFPANYVKLLSPGTSKVTPTEPPKPPAFPAGERCPAPAAPASHGLPTGRQCRGREGSSSCEATRVRLPKGPFRQLLRQRLWP